MEDEEKKYRDFINNIVVSGIGSQLNEIDKIIHDPNLTTNKLLESFKKEIDELNNYSKIPKNYVRVNEMLLNSCRAYSKGTNYLIQARTNGRNDIKLVQLSGRYLTEGNCWLEIARIRQLEALDYGNNAKIN